LAGHANSKKCDKLLRHPIDSP